MLKRTSTLAQSKRWENRVSQYLFGKPRDWKEQWDVSGYKSDGDPRWDLCIGEVKCRSGLTFPEGCRLAIEALAQLAEAACPLQKPWEREATLFVVIHAKGAPLEKDWVFVSSGDRAQGPYTLEEFRAGWTAARELTAEDPPD
jgi:hypothetical protein